MIKISSSHWTFPPFPETFVCLFLFGDFILQHLFLFVNSFLKIFYTIFNYLLPVASDMAPSSLLNTVSLFSSMRDKAASAKQSGIFRTCIRYVINKYIPADLSVNNHMLSTDHHYRENHLPFYRP
jgi:hypothetical protein